MIDFIKRLFCKHEFEDISGEIRVWGSDPHYKYPIEYRRVFVCKKCLKKKTIKYRGNVQMKVRWFNAYVKNDCNRKYRKLLCFDE